MMGAVESWGAIVAESGRMSGSIRLSGDSNVFSRSCREVDDEEALKWAALEKLPTYNRMRRAILKGVVEEDGSQAHKEVNVAELSFHERQSLINKILRVTEEDNERFLLKLRDRIDKVGIDLPKIEVRFEHLTVNADIYVGSRTLPTLFNFSMNMLEGILSWFHLSLTKKRDLNILCNVSGIIKPSRMTLLLGPPTSGKTTLLLALAGKLDPDLRVSGVVTYNGHTLDEFVPQRTSAYISQHDLHIGEMTVRETLDFCGRCLGVGSRYGFGTVLEMLMELSRREKEIGIKPDPDIDVFMKAAALSGQETSLISDYVLKILGLDICADILVGDNLQRGISGGQKKRVTTGEILVGPAKALFMDEISTGLDSSTTYQIVKCLRHTVHVLDGTILVSLLQPAPETFDLFDDLILLSEGQIVYQGPRDLVLDFFESMGFKCPERKGTADFLQEVTSRKDQGQYWVNTSMPYRYIPVKEFAEAFKSFHVGQSLAEEVAVPFDRLTSHPAALSMEKYGLSKWELLKACFAREWLLIKRNMFVYVFNFIQISFIAFVTMTLFLRTELQPNTIDDGNLYMGALFFALVTTMFNGFAELSMTVFRLPVFYKQRDLLLYPAWAFSLPTSIMRVPISLLEAGIWTGSTYYVIGFAPEPERFFRQYFLLFCVHQMSQGLFRLIASVGRTMVLSNTFGPFMLLIIFVLSGFVISRDDIRVSWIWGYWISPMMYGYNAICVNEFLSPRWNKPNNNSSVDEPTIGRAILRSRGIFPDAYWYWLGIGALLGFTVLFNVLFTVALAYLNPLGKPQAIIPEDILQEKHANLTGENITESSRSKSHQRLSADHTTTANKGIELPARQLSMSFIASLDDAVEAKGMAPERGMVLPFQPLWMAFHNINYFVDMPAEMKKQGEEQNRLQLLQNVSGIFRPGVLTALVGVSGAGKMTLMDALAGRKTGGYIEGTISISGYPKNQETFTRISGYCEQNDIHSPSVTVEESLIFSAWLRLPKDIDADTRKRFVKEVMDLVELTPLRNAMVGLPGVSGLSMEQRKRLTIAVELVANPSIIFMDEPTSGLDARAAAIVMRTVRNTVDTGRTIVCTIHQPSIDIFEAFNELLLMKCGGRVIYSGTLGRCSHRLVEYFEAIPGVPKIKEGYNPATWMLEVSSQSTEEKLSIDFADLYNKSSNHQHTEALIEELNKEAPGSKDIHFPTKYSQTFFMQCIICLWKQHHSYWRKPEYNITRFFFTTVSALSFGSIYWDLGKKMSKQQDLINVIGALYAAVLFIGVNNSSAAQPVVAIERIVFYRERAAGMYSALPYAFAQVLVEMPYVFVQTLVYSIIVYSMVAFQWTVVKCCWFIFFMFFTFMYFTTYGMMTVGVTPNFHFAGIIAFTFYILWNLFSGFVIPQTRIPMWWRWYYWANPVSWSLYGLITSQLGDVDDLMLQIPGESEPKSVSKYIHDYLGYDYDFLGVVAGMHVAIAVLFALTFGICIKYLNFQRR